MMRFPRLGWLSPDLNPAVRGPGPEALVGSRGQFLAGFRAEL